MKIILMRHGNALKGRIDHERGLSEEGAREADAAGMFLRSIGEVPDVILHSTLRRSRETAERVEAALEAEGLLEERGNLTPGDSPEHFHSGLMAEFDERLGSDYKVMVVGHDPFISDLASFLVWRYQCGLPFSTGTLLEAKGSNPKDAWDLCFYVRAKYLTRRGA
ncbi:MAG: histidine phosphatase family protein [Synergistaceae bacterium]|nr:histidine phosphatase family protein [Synergistaceae bacterium]